MADSAPRPAYRVETARLVLRCWSPADAPALKDAVDGCLDWLQEWLPWAADHPKSIDEVSVDLRAIRRRFDGDEDYTYGIFDSGETRVIGGTGLHLRVGPDAREIGYWIRADHAGAGLATESSAALCRVAFEVDRVQRVDIRCEPANLASARVAEKLGFRHEATLRRVLKPGREGTLRDSMIWTLLAEDFPSSRAAALSPSIRAFDMLGRPLL